jgi:hypothetical protein
MNMRFVLLAVMVLLVACSSDNENLSAAISASFNYVDKTDCFTLISTSTGEIDEYQWHVLWNQQVRLLSPTASEAKLELPSEATTVIVSLTVKNSSGGTSTNTLNIDLPQLTFARQYGLGKNTEYERSNNVTYEWYMSQHNTGIYSAINCGPVCATMAIKWSNPDFSKTPEDVRNTYLPNGGLFSTYDIIVCLNVNQTAYFSANLSELNHLRTQLDHGNIAVLCLDMYYVRLYSGDPEWRINKYYITESPGWGHFIIAKGYKIVDGQIWFEIYDPWTLTRYYDGSFKGRDRYYRGNDIIQASNSWWPHMIVINNPENPTLRMNAIDPSTIVHQWGR